MPSRKSLKRYPLWYFDLIKSAQRQAVKVVVRNPASFRRDMYNFRATLRQSAADDPSNEELQNARARIDRLVFSLQGDAVLVHQTGQNPVSIGLMEYMKHE